MYCGLTELLNLELVSLAEHVLRLNLHLQLGIADGDSLGGLNLGDLGLPVPAFPFMARSVIEAALSAFLVFSNTRTYALTLAFSLSASPSLQKK